MAKPLLSRSLANKIRRAQDDVTNCRRSIIRGELAPDCFRADIDIIHEWHRDGTLDASAATSRIEYFQRQLTRETARQPERFFELAKAEQQLDEVQAEAALAISKIKPGTILVAWPRGLSSFETVADRYRQQQHRENEEAREKAGRYFRRLDATYSRQMAKHDAAISNAMTDLAAALAKAVKTGEMSEGAALTFIRNFTGR